MECYYAPVVEAGKKKAIRNQCEDSQCLFATKSANQVPHIIQNRPFIRPYEDIHKDASQSTRVSESEEI